MINPVLLARNDAIAAEELVLDTIGNVERFETDDGIGSLTERLIRIRGELVEIVDELEREMEGEQ